MTRRATIVAALAVAVLVPSVAQAGPPLVCFPFDIGAEASLPWGSDPGWKAPQPHYDRARLVGDTVALLTPSTRVLVRMETLRRATVYASTDADAARALLGRLDERAQAEGSALGLFDAGYLRETYRQGRAISGSKLVADAADGYPAIERALPLSGHDPEMEYAAALVTMGRQPEESRRHLDRAVAGAAAGSLLARTIERHHALWGASLGDLRVRLGSDR